jgi:hypothetical protein
MCRTFALTGVALIAATSLSATTVLYATDASPTTAPAVRTPGVGDAARDFALTAVDGSDVRLSTLSTEKHVVLVFQQSADDRPPGLPTCSGDRDLRQGAKLTRALCPNWPCSGVRPQDMSR